jgi:hypothetical protein
MFRRNNKNDILPSTAYGTGRGSGGGLPFGGGGSHDGSGRSIKMDAPVVKAWRKASVYTRVSYCLLGLSFFMIFYGFRSLRYWNGTSKLCRPSFNDSLLSVDYELLQYYHLWP